MYKCFFITTFPGTVHSATNGYLEQAHVILLLKFHFVLIKSPVNLLDITFVGPMFFVSYMSLVFVAR